jgi:hypothetical protein
MTKWISNVVIVISAGGTKAWTAVKLVFTSAVLPGRYHPEAHYMRGPGPKWRARQAKLAG